MNYVMFVKYAFAEDTNVYSKTRQMSVLFLSNRMLFTACVYLSIVLRSCITLHLVSRTSESHLGNRFCAYEALVLFSYRLSIFSYSPDSHIQMHNGNAVLHT